jgi:hypothetical protein
VLSQVDVRNSAAWQRVDFNAPNSLLNIFPSMATDKLTQLEVAARVEAAVARYRLVREESDEKVWREAFEKEWVSFSFTRHLHLIQISSSHFSIEKGEQSVSPRQGSQWGSTEAAPSDPRRAVNRARDKGRSRQHFQFQPAHPRIQAL